MATLASSAPAQQHPTASAGPARVARAVLAFAIASAIACTFIWLRDLSASPWRYPKWDDGWMAEVLEWTPRISGLLYAWAGVTILSRARTQRVGLLCVLFAFLMALYDILTMLPLVISAYSAVVPIYIGARLTFGLLFPAPFVWLLLVFPTGEFQSPRERALAGLAMLSWIQPLLYAALVPTFWLSHADASITNPFYIGTWQSRARFEQIEGIVTTAFIAFSFALMALALAGYVRRMRAADTQARRQMQWLALVFGAVLLFFAIGALVAVSGSDGWLFFMLGMLVLLMGTPVAIVIAMLRHRLFDVDLVLNRALVYGSLVVLIAAAYALIVGGLSAVFSTSGDLLFGVIATGIIAVLFNPVRTSLQRAVNRMVYGEPADPAAALARIHRLIETAPSSDIAMQSLLEEIERDGLAREPTAAQHAARLMRDLQRSRERIVTAREEERRRLRRDLHDRLGPTLAAHTLKLDAVIDLIATDPERAGQELQKLKAQSQVTVADIRRLVYDLRPPALDELGLTGAIQAFAGQMSDPMRIEVAAPDALPPLPAAVEAAAYRITAEAITNAARHARATRCAVRISIEARHGTAASSDAAASQGVALRIVIEDDGIGLPPDHAIGVGMSSMRERAEELGGTVAITSPPGGGTRVEAELPL